MRKIVLTLGSSRIRFAIGLLLACLVLAQIFATFDGNRVTASTSAISLVNPAGSLQMKDARLIENLARTDHGALLELALDRYHRQVQDYTCTLSKQERLGGALTPVQVVQIKFKENPFSVLMAWQVNAPRGDKMLYVESSPAGKNLMYIHPSGLPGMVIKSVERSPDDPEVLKSSLRSIKEFGFARGMDALVSVYRLASQNGDLQEQSYMGTGKVGGRPTIMLKRVIRAREGVSYPAFVTIIELDQEYLVPVHVRGTDWQNNLLCDYTYTNIKFNVRLSDSDFTRATNGL